MIAQSGSTYLRLEFVTLEMSVKGFMSLCCNFDITAFKHCSESHMSRFAVLLRGRVRVRVWSREQRKIKRRMALLSL